MPDSTVILTERFERALVMANQLHRKQLKKGTDVPYMAHLLGVTAIVLEHGGDEDQAIAALLHDAVEDQGGVKTLRKIRRMFGDRVERIVEDCTDAWGHPKPDWRDRKEKYLAALPKKDPDSLLVSLADKVYNARAIRDDYRSVGDEVWTRFKGDKEGTKWYYQSLVKVFSEVTEGPLVDELTEVVEGIW